MRRSLESWDLALRETLHQRLDRDDRQRFSLLQSPRRVGRLMMTNVLMIMFWALSCSVFFWLGRTRREDEVISNYRKRIVKDEREVAARKSKITGDRPRVRDIKIRSTRRGYYGEDVDEESQQ